MSNSNFIGTNAYEYQQKTNHFLNHLFIKMYTLISLIDNNLISSANETQFTLSKPSRNPY